MNQSVCAVVVTYNRKDLLWVCLQALKDQSHPLESIVVVDNASTDGTAAEVKEKFPEVDLVALKENTGGSGGFHEGVKHAYAKGYDWLWLMDDDCRPELNCLEKLYEKAQPNSVVIPIQIGREGPHGILGWQGGNYVDLDVDTKIPRNGSRAGRKRPTKELLFTFVGPLISKGVIDKVGLPHPGYFIWFDDFEYAFRIRRYMKHRFTVVTDAKIYHDPGISQQEVRLLGIGKPKLRATFAVWRSYYMARNSLYTLTRTRGRMWEVLLFLFRQIRVLTAIVLYDPDRSVRLRMHLRGLFDGAFGRMGKRH
jgi:rhamnopyranosyl-N-acetylglucosaminyl-diphospho-decaprenol beta-1,3/1,4-galactofuranosyltransferase